MSGGNPAYNDDGTNTNRLGTLEFISAINGDDPLAALRALRKFVRTVRRERRLALLGGGGGGRSSRRSGGGGKDNCGHLGNDSGSDDDSEDEGDDDLDRLLDSSSGTSQKKRRTAASSSEGNSNSKRDKWKDDTAGYNVPFVGTSVTKGSTGTPIRPGVWPCGLLEAYLIGSPRAVELLGGLQTTSTTGAGNNDADKGGRDGRGYGGNKDGRTGRSTYSSRSVVTTNANQLVPPHGALHRPLLKSHKTQQLSTALHAAYLEAVEELCTAVVPTKVLKKDMRRRMMSGAAGEGGVEADEEDKNASTGGSNTTTYDAIATSLARDHLRPFLHLLNEQCSHAASFDPKHGGGGGGGGRHRVGPLTPTLLRLLTNIAATGVGAAREVVRGLDSELRDGALRAALAAYSGGAGGGGGKSGGGRSARPSMMAVTTTTTATTRQKKRMTNPLR